MSTYTVEKYVPVEGPGSYTANECSVRVSNSRGFGSHTCSNRAVVIVTTAEGKKFKYCGTHNPEKIAAREKAKREAWERDRAYKLSVEKGALALCKQLGAGRPEFYRDPRGTDSRYTGSVVLTPTEVKELLSRLLLPL